MQRIVGGDSPLLLDGGMRREVTKEQCPRCVCVREVDEQEVLCMYGDGQCSCTMQGARNLR